MSRKDGSQDRRCRRKESVRSTGSRNNVKVEKPPPRRSVVQRGKCPAMRRISLLGVLHARTSRGTDTVVCSVIGSPSALRGYISGPGNSALKRKLSVVPPVF